MDVRLTIEEIEQAVASEYLHLAHLGAGVTTWVWGISDGDPRRVCDAIRLARNRTREQVEQVLTFSRENGTVFPWWLAEVSVLTNVSPVDALICLRSLICDAWAGALRAHDMLEQTRCAELSRLWLSRSVWWIRTHPTDVPSIVLRGVNRAWSLSEPDPDELALLDRVAPNDENRWWLQAVRASVLHRLERHAEALEVIERLPSCDSGPERMAHRASQASVLRALRQPSAAAQVLDVWEHGLGDTPDTAGERALTGLLRVPLVVLEEGSERAVELAEQILASLPEGRAEWYRALLHWQIVVMTDTWQRRERAREHCRLGVELLMRLGDRRLLPEMLRWQVSDALGRGDTAASELAMGTLESVVSDGGPAARMICCQARAHLATDAHTTDRWIRTGNLLAGRSGRSALLRRTMAEEIACLEVGVTADGEALVRSDGEEVIVGASTAPGAVLRVLEATALYPPLLVTREELTEVLERWRRGNREPQTVALQQVLEDLQASGLGDALATDGDRYRLLGVRVLQARAHRAAAGQSV